MAIRITSEIAPSGNNPNIFTHEDIFGKGGFIALDTAGSSGTIQDKLNDLVTPARRKSGMLVYDVSTSEYYRLDNNGTTWVTENFSSSIGSSLEQGNGILIEDLTNNVSKISIDSTVVTLTGEQNLTNKTINGITIVESENATPPGIAYLGNSYGVVFVPTFDLDPEKQNFTTIALPESFEVVLDGEPSEGESLVWNGTHWTNFMVSGSLGGTDGGAAPSSSKFVTWGQDIGLSDEKVLTGSENIIIDVSGADTAIVSLNTNSNYFNSLVKFEDLPQTTDGVLDIAQQSSLNDLIDLVNSLDLSGGSISIEEGNGISIEELTNNNFKISVDSTIVTLNGVQALLNKTINGLSLEDAGGQGGVGFSIYTGMFGAGIAGFPGSSLTILDASDITFGQYDQGPSSVLVPTSGNLLSTTWFGTTGQSLDTAGATNGQSLVYNSSTNKWVPSTVAGGVVDTNGMFVTSLFELEDVLITSVAQNNILVYDKSTEKWQNVDLFEAIKVYFNTDTEGNLDIASQSSLDALAALVNDLVLCCSEKDCGSIGTDDACLLQICPVATSESFGYLYWNGNDWSLDIPTDTTYTAGNGLTLSGTEFSVSAGTGLGFAGAGGKELINTDLGSSQNIFKTIAITGTSGQSSVVANQNNDTFTLNAGANVSITTSGKTITIAAQVSGSSTLNDLSDVTISNPVNGNILVYDTNVWINTNTLYGGAADSFT